MNETISGLVSTIIPVYNRAGMVRAAVDSVLSQTYRPIEIILVDDGSNDGETPDVLESMASGWPDVIRVIHRPNGGPGLARESGRQAAHGEFIQYLDSDDWLLPNKFELQVGALRKRPECGIAYGITHLVDDAGNILKSPSKRTGESHARLFPLLLTERWWHTSTPLYSRWISDAAGPWPRQRPEDWDLEARMGALDVPLVRCERAVSCHREHAESGRVSRGDQLSYYRDEAWFLPRLYECARRAGVNPADPEMRHFARWAFMRARTLGTAGETGLARRLLVLARTSAGGGHADMKLVAGAARLLGWRLTGKIAQFHDRWWRRDPTAVKT